MLINDELIKDIVEQAKSSTRLRKNYNFHVSLDAPCQRMLNTMLVGTKFEIHRHTNTSETFVILKGKLDLIYYNDNAEETERFRIDPAIGNYGINIPAGQWHSLEILDDATIFETREGPYIPVSKENGLIL